ncbi:MAG: hypothetical protein HRU15_02875 [Planctomycetes bacterium]|nr:hypothetical protein [Planctomycetota bacterium]
MNKTTKKTLRDVVQSLAYSKKEIETYVNDELENWGTFDPVVGYLPMPWKANDNIDGSQSMFTGGGKKPRSQWNYAQDTARIACYGDSYTQCNQTSDCETWPEYLGGHFREPILNFGAGGQGVYQSYHVMQQREQEGHACPVHILTIFDDDNFRSIDLQRWNRSDARLRNGPEDFRMMHSTPWCHLRYEPEINDFKEMSNPCNTKESLFQLCDPDFLHDLLQDDFVVNCMLAKDGYEVANIQYLRDVNESLALGLDFSDADNCADAAGDLMRAVAFRSSIFTVKLWEKYAADNNIKLCVSLVYGSNHNQDYMRGQGRDDQVLADYLRQADLQFHDHMEVHKKEYDRLGCSDPDVYIASFHNGHHSPRGNHFLAYKLKDTLLPILDPKPAPYL